MWNNGIVSRPLSSNENDLLVGHELASLVIEDIDGNTVKTLNTKGGWTHELLESIDIHQIAPHGWNAYLGGQWIGSSEI